MAQYPTRADTRSLHDPCKMWGRRRSGPGGVYVRANTVPLRVPELWTPGRGDVDTANGPRRVVEFLAAFRTLIVVMLLCVVFSSCVLYSLSIYQPDIRSLLLLDEEKSWDSSL